MSQEEIMEAKKLFDILLDEYTKINIENKSYIEYIYLLQKKENIKFNQYIYKIGKTKLINFKRFTYYPSKTLVLHHTYCKNSDKCEKKL